MTTIYADFNAMTEDRSISMTTKGSRDDIEKFGVQPGDWVWLSDGEMQVGAKIIENEGQELVAIPEWDTVADLYCEDANSDRNLKLYEEWKNLTCRPGFHDPANQRRIIELTLQIEQIAPPEILGIQPVHFTFLRAMALSILGKFELALKEIESALAINPRASTFEFVLLDALRQMAPLRALTEAERLASSPSVEASLLFELIQILAYHAEDLPDEQFTDFAERTLELCEQFEDSVGRGQVTAKLLSLFHFHRGLILLRLGQTVAAHAALDLAHAIDPIDPTLIEATRLVAYDQNARDIACRIRARPLAA